MASSEPKFPAEIATAVEYPHVFIPDDRRPELWVSTGERDNRSTWREAMPYEAGFELKTNGVRTIPLRMYEYQQVQRSVMGFLMGQNDQIDPSTDMTVDRPIGKRGRQVTAKLMRQPEGRHHAGLLILHNGANVPDRGELNNTFPESQIFRARMFDVVQLPHTPASHWERTYEVQFGHDTKTTHKEETLDARPEGQLTPDLRDALLQHGKIVYERVPPGADRLLICVKHIHGKAGDQLIQNVTHPDDVQRFTPHQEGIKAIQRAVIQRSNPDSIRFFAETFNRTFADATTEVQTFFRDKATFESRTQSPEFQAGITGQLSTLLKLPQDFIHRALFGYNIARDEILAHCIRTNTTHLLHGDGRPENWEQSSNALNDLSTRAGNAAQHFGQSADAASDFAKISRARDEIVHHAANASMTAEISATLQPGTTGYMVYGGGHFSHGTTDQNDISRNSLEEHFKFLPRTHVVVVEEHTYPQLHEVYEQSIDTAVLKNKRYRNENAHILNKIYTFSGYAPRVLQNCVFPKDPSERDKSWNALCHILKDLHALLERLKSQI